MNADSFARTYCTISTQLYVQYHTIFHERGTRTKQSLITPITLTPRLSIIWDIQCSLFLADLVAGKDGTQQKHKSHDFLVNIVSGVFARCTYLGLGPESQEAKAIAEICNVWHDLLNPIILPEVGHLLSHKDIICLAVSNQYMTCCPFLAMFTSDASL